MFNKKPKIKVKIEGLDVSTVKGQQLAREVAEVVKKYTTDGKMVEEQKEHTKH